MNACDIIIHEQRDEQRKAVAELTARIKRLEAGDQTLEREPARRLRSVGEPGARGK